MKKTYLKPATEELNLLMENLMEFVASDTEVMGDDILSRHHNKVWDDEEVDEEF